MAFKVLFPWRTLVSRSWQLQGNSARHVNGMQKQESVQGEKEAPVNKAGLVIKEEIVTKKALEVGDTVTVNKLVSTGDIDDFCELTGDYNTLHTEARIVHGAFLNGLVSSVIGTVLPGPGSMVVSQRLEFPHSCVAPQCVSVTVVLTSVRKIIACTFQCRTMDGLVVMQGDAKLLRK